MDTGSSRASTSEAALSQAASEMSALNNALHRYKIVDYYCTSVRAQYGENLPNELETHFREEEKERRRELQAKTWTLAT